MAEETTKTIKIKVEFTGDATEAKAAADTVGAAQDKITKSSKEQGEAFGLMDTNIGKMGKGVVDFGQKGVKAMTSLKGAIAATGIGLLVIAVAGLVEWFKKTETGTDLIAKGMKILGQVVKEGPMAVFNGLKIVVLALLVPMRTAISTFKNMKDVLSGKQSLSEAMQNIKADVASFGEEIVETASKFKGMGQNILDAAKLADKWDALDDARRDRRVKDKQLEADIADLRERAADADTELADKVKLLTQAQGLLSGQHQTLKKDKEEEIKLIEEELRLYPDNAEWIEKLAIAKGELADIDRAYSKEKKTLGKQQQAAEKQILSESVKAEKEAAEETQKIREAFRKASEERAERSEEREKRLRLMRLTGQARELEEVAIWYEEQQKLETDFYLSRESIEEEHQLKLKEINDKYAKEKADQEKKDFEDWCAQMDAKDAREKEAAEKKKADNAAYLNSAKDTLQKSSELFKKGSKAQKAFSIAATVIDTYQSATAAFKSLAGIPVVGPVLGGIAAAAAIAMGLKNIAMIRKTEPESKALGGWLGGPSHQDGGIPIVAEGGEYMVNKRTMSNPMMAQSIMAMNQAGNTGYGSGSMLTEARVAEIAASVVASIPVYVTEGAITEKQKKVEIRESRFVQ